MAAGREDDGGGSWLGGGQANRGGFGSGVMEGRAGAVPEREVDGGSGWPRGGRANGGGSWI